MRTRAGSGTVLVASCLMACLPKPEPSHSDVPVTHAEPLIEDGVERVARFSVSFSSAVLDPDDAWLFRGELSDYHLGRINRRELPETLSERRVAVNAWFDPELAQTFVAPVAELVPGETYTLAAPGWGRLFAASVRLESDLAMMKRLWPLAGNPARAMAIYCGESAELENAELESAELELAPSHLRAAVVAGVGRTMSGARCVRLDFVPPEPSVPWLLLPPLVASVLWDPTPLAFQSEEPRHDGPCAPNELSFEGGCATPFDDRVVIRNGPDPLLYAFEVDAETLLVPLGAGESFVWRGLAPDGPQLLLGKSIDRFGGERGFELSFRTLPAAAHLVLNEVLANALGPEPASEWVELVNDGSAPADLGGLRLADGAGDVELPEARLDPGAYALLVRDDFVDNAVDVAPAADALVIRVPSLGKNGLSNAGELLTLLDASGRVLSRIPALASGHAGVSIARRTPSAPDAAADSFGEHAAPGASPGAPNVLAASGAR